MKYKLIISDYDGTLANLGAKCTIDNDTVNAIKEYENRGGKFVICTGRPYCSIKNIQKKYNLKGLVATLQGAYVCDIETGEKVFEKGLSVETALDVLKEFRQEKDATPIVFIGEHFYAECRDERVKFYENADQAKAVIVDSLEELIKSVSVVGKIILEINPSSERIKRLRQKYSKKSNQNVLYTYAVDYGYEAINPRFTKKEAVEFLIDYYGFTPKEVMAVGDGFNDVPLLSGDWHGVCIGDGHEKLKEIAKEITLPLNEKPIKHLIEKQFKD